MRRNVTGIGLAVACLLLAACAQPDAGQRARIDYLENRVRDLDRSRQDLEERLGKIEAERAAQAKNELVITLDKTAPESGNATAQGNATGESPRLNLAQPAQAQTQTKIQTAEPAPTADVPTDPAYQAALKAYESGKYVEARRMFKAFADANPKSPLLPNALYWTGETHYSEKSFAQAILAFRDVVKRFPKHPKAPDALIKTAMSYERLGDLQNAEFYLKAMLDEYPKAERADLAKKLLAEFQKRQ